MKKIEDLNLYSCLYCCFCFVPPEGIGIACEFMVTLWGWGCWIGVSSGVVRKNVVSESIAYQRGRETEVDARVKSGSHITEYI